MMDDFSGDLQKSTLESIDDQLCFIYDQIRQGYIGNILQSAVNVQLTIDRIVWYLNFLNNKSLMSDDPLLDDFKFVGEFS